MQWCLYDPVIGYYRRPGVVGKTGDFLTSPRTHRLFAELLAEFAARSLELLASGPLQIVELGAGEGLLGGQVTSILRERRSRLVSRLEYVPVDTDGPGLPDSIRGLVLSNEFFDALPVHRVRVRGSCLREIHVVFHEGEFKEVEGDLSDPRIEDFMRKGYPIWRDGAAYEVNLSMLDWLEELDGRIDQALVLTLDYGHDWPAYNSRPRPDGTLLCYQKHRAHANPYVDIGLQDITSHVCFRCLLDQTRRLGWKDEPIQTQREFLMAQGLGRLLVAEENRGLFNTERLEDRLGLKSLLEPGGVSDAISVLVHRVRTDQGGPGRGGVS